MVKKTIITKIIIVTCIILLLISIVLLTIIREGIDFQELKKEHDFFKLLDINNPNQMLWFGDELLFEKDSIVKKLDENERMLEKFLEIQNNQILANYKDELVLMSYENYVITEPEQYASNIEVISIEGKIIFSQKFHQTIKPTHIKNDFLFLIDNYPNSPERTYKVDLNSKKIELFEIKEQFILQGDETIKILDQKSNLLLEIPKANDITSFSINDKINKIALVDIQGDVWIYLKNPNE